MRIECPYCGSEEYECYDRVGDGTIEPIDLCVCEACDKQFQIVYTVNRIATERWKTLFFLCIFAIG